VASSASPKVWYRVAKAAELPPGRWDRLLTFAAECHKRLALKQVCGIALYTEATYADRLRLPDSKVEPWPHENRGYYCPGSDHVWLKIAPGQHEHDLYEVIAHELRHAYQHEHGDSTDTAGLPYEQYLAHPAEVDARAWATLAVATYELEQRTQSAFAKAQSEQAIERSYADLQAAFAWLSA
jgi:hypothetical protein